MVIAVIKFMQTFDFSTLEKVDLECEDCGWLGNGYETEKSFASLPNAIDIVCPVCGFYLGEVKKVQ